MGFYAKSIFLCPLHSPIPLLFPTSLPTCSRETRLCKGKAAYTLWGVCNDMWIVTNCCILCPLHNPLNSLLPQGIKCLGLPIGGSENMTVFFTDPFIVLNEHKGDRCCFLLIKFWDSKHEWLFLSSIYCYKQILRRTSSVEQIGLSRLCGCLWGNTINWMFV